MRFVGFAVLLKVMMNRDMWGFFLMGFGLALITVANDSLATPALLILALIGFGIAFWDFQQQTELKGEQLFKNQPSAALLKRLLILWEMNRL